MVLSVVAVFVIVLLVCLGILLFVLRESRTRRQIGSRLDALTAPMLEKVKTRESKERDAWLAARIEARLKGSRFRSRIFRLLVQARSRLSMSDFLLLCCLFSLVSAVIAWLISANVLAACGALAGGAVLPYFWIGMKGKRRMKKFGEGLPNAIDLMARALRAGHSVQQALEVLAEQSRDPIREEFEQVHQEQKLAVPFRDALCALGERVPLQDLRFVITAILVQKETGGDLIDILDRTAHTIRERLRVMGEVRTNTAQGRLTGWVLSLMPIFLLGIMSLIMPDYSTILFTNPLGQKMLMAGLFLLALGAFTIRRIVDIEV